MTEQAMNESAGRESITFDRINELPRSPGVYFIWKGGECVYIGSSGNLRKRMKRHNLASQFPTCERLEWIPCQTRWDALKLEDQLIKELKPKWNWNTGQFTRANVVVLNLDEIQQRRVRLLAEHFSKNWGSTMTPASAIKMAIFKCVQRRGLISKEELP
jgi:predicted GIY-YIG superfamily endonuclease